jgi:hypothetical protein
MVRSPVCRQSIYIVLKILLMNPYRKRPQNDEPAPLTPNPYPCTSIYPNAIQIDPNGESTGDAYSS